MTLARPPHCLWHALRSPMQAPATPAREGTTAAPPPHHHHQQRTGEKERRKEGRKEGRKERKGEGEKGLASVQIPRIPDPKFTRNTNAHTHSRERREEERERGREREREKERERERERERNKPRTVKSVVWNAREGFRWGMLGGNVLTCFIHSGRPSYIVTWDSTTHTEHAPSTMEATRKSKGAMYAE